MRGARAARERRDSAARTKEPPGGRPSGGADALPIAGLSTRKLDIEAEIVTDLDAS